ncbi:hypothetical protein [Acaryochloris sp. IP29b_bin.137]|uniref:hypothetical protein n=1 Tax=Acaryochloris sp. IP29b_bin.137 TaxID=2969217 RepID=UPI00260CDD50|nr:hypothetical protein [Acaryochloris sp. IP29b_bin.137]
MMNKTIDIQELAFVVAAKNYEPSLLNPGFLKYSGIIPSDWELSRQPVFNDRVAQIVFNNGVNIVGEPNRFMLIEAMGTKSEETLDSPQVSQRYIQTLSNLDYQGVGINFRGYIPFAANSSDAHEYLFKHLFSEGSWQTCGTAPVQAGLNLVYTFENSQLNLSVNEAKLQLPEQEQVPVILFSGNFDYALSDIAESDRLGRLQEIIGNWQTDLNSFKQVVNQFPQIDVKEEPLNVDEEAMSGAIPALVD